MFKDTAAKKEAAERAVLDAAKKKGKLEKYGLVDLEAELQNVEKERNELRGETGDARKKGESQPIEDILHIAKSEKRSRQDKDKAEKRLSSRKTLKSKRVGKRERLEANTQYHAKERTKSRSDSRTKGKAQKGTCGESKEDTGTHNMGAVSKAELNEDEKQGSKHPPTSSDKLVEQSFSTQSIPQQQSRVDREGSFDVKDPVDNIKSDPVEMNSSCHTPTVSVESLHAIEGQSVQPDQPQDVQNFSEELHATAAPINLSQHSGDQLTTPQLENRGVTMSNTHLENQSPESDGSSKSSSSSSSVDSIIGSTKSGSTSTGSTKSSSASVGSMKSSTTSTKSSSTSSGSMKSSSTSSDSISASVGSMKSTSTSSGSTSASVDSTSVGSSESSSTSASGSEHPSEVPTPSSYGTSDTGSCRSSPSDHSSDNLSNSGSETESNASLGSEKVHSENSNATSKSPSSSS